MKTVQTIYGVFDTDLGRLVGIAPQGVPDVTFLAGQDTQTVGDPVTAKVNPLTGGVESLMVGDGQSLSFESARILTAPWSSDVAVTATVFAPFTINTPVTLNRVSGTVGVTQSGKLVEIGVYSESKKLLVSTDRREVPDAGVFEFAHPEITLPAGNYFYALTCNGTTATFGMANGMGGFTGALALPLPATFGAITASSTFPSLTGQQKINRSVVNSLDLSDSRYRVYGGDAAGKVFAIDTQLFKLAYTTNGGVSWSSMMAYPSIGGDAWIDMAASATKLYLLTMGGRVFETSGFTASDTISEISCPQTMGLRRATTKGRPYCLTVFQDYLLQGEYSIDSSGDTITDPIDPSGPRVFKYGPLSGAPIWTLSKQFSAARHVHGFYTVGASKTWVCLGDANAGSDIGLWRMTDATTNNWSKWTGFGGSFSDHYPVDFLEVAQPGAAQGLYGAGDRPGVHMTFVKSAGGAGAFNLSAQIPTPIGQPSGETVRSIVFDFATKNLYWFSAETTDPALYMSPPPYTQSTRVQSVVAALLTRGVVQNGYLLMYDRRYQVPKFSWQ